MAKARCAAGADAEGCAPAIRSDQELALREPGTSVLVRTMEKTSEIYFSVNTLKFRRYFFLLRDRAGCAGVTQFPYRLGSTGNAAERKGMDVGRTCDRNVADARTDVPPIDGLDRATRGDVTGNGLAWPPVTERRQPCRADPPTAKPVQRPMKRRLCGGMANRAFSTDDSDANLAQGCALAPDQP